MRRRSLRMMLAVTTATACLGVLATGRAGAEEPRAQAIPSLRLSPTLRQLLDMLNAPMRIEVPARLEDKHFRPPPSGAPEDWFTRPRGWFGALMFRF